MGIRGEVAEVLEERVRNAEGIVEEEGGNESGMGKAE